MSPRRTDADGMRPLEALGIGELEERAYRALLAHRTATVEDVAHLLALPTRKAQRLLDSLEGKGLATHSPERPRRYIPASPDIAIEVLVSQRQADLERARSTIVELKEQAANAADSAELEQMVEVVTSRDAARQIISNLQRTIQKDVVCLQRSPTVFSSLEPKDDLQKQGLAKGGRSRSIADIEFLEHPGAVQRIRYDMAAGEEVRVYPALPFKLVIADRRVGMLPLNLRKPDGPWLLVRSSALLDALYELFEILWERSTPIAFTRLRRLSARSQRCRGSAFAHFLDSEEDPINPPDVMPANAGIH